MKKEYTSPVINVTVIEEADVIMASGLTKTQGTQTQPQLGTLTVPF